MLLDVRCRLHELPCHGHPQLVGAHGHPAYGNERQMAVEESFLDGGELWFVGLDVDIDVLQFSDLPAVDVDDRLAVPVGDIPRRSLLVLCHFTTLPGSSCD